ncbi:hypothetical protein SAMN05660209_01732 [Geodermatophilus africanus]|uniref:Type III restriction enzyme, res subunit n=1 Tax=Geodermatophilus africanus TaxID=1137993 RepID=A0A1H3G562_9ACTN|nr:DEAD/DEAH box helicase family protein [Geodermatophilus africanus]SDX98177.1 hypothetical protein SAMN05660209_01732 [Geodermatophilus africanus]
MQEFDVHNLRSFDYGTLAGGRFKPHQAEGIAIMATTPKTLCADPTGAGKTVQAGGVLAVLADWRNLPRDRPALVVTRGRHLAAQTAADLARYLPG